MVITMLEARVDPDHADELEKAFREEAVPLPPAIHETFLVRDSARSSTFRIITVWKSQEALDQMRERAQAAGEKPKGVQILEAVGAKPRLSISNVMVHHG